MLLKTARDHERLLFLLSVPDCVVEIEFEEVFELLADSSILKRTLFSLLTGLMMPFAGNCWLAAALPAALACPAMYISVE